MVNILTWSTTLQNRLSDGICSFFRVIDQEEAYLTDVAIGKLLIRLILLKWPICTTRVLFCMQLQTGRILILRAFYLELFNCMVITLLIIGLVEGFLQGIVVFGGLLRLLQVLYILVVLDILSFIFAQCLVILHVCFLFLKIVIAAVECDIVL